MEVKDCLGLIVQIRNNINTQWSYYFILITLVIGWLVIGKPPELSLPLKVLGTAGYVLFAILNLPGLLGMYRMLHVITEEAHAISETSGLTSNAGQTWLRGLSFRNRIVIACAVHLAVGCAVLALIWWDALRLPGRS